MDTSKKEYLGKCLLNSWYGVMQYEVLYKGKQIIILIIPYIFYLYKIACFYCQFRMIKQKWLWVPRSFVWNKLVHMQNIPTTTRYNENGDSKNRCPVVLSLSLMAVLYIMFYQTVIVKHTINFNCVNLLQYLFCAAKK